MITLSSAIWMTSPMRRSLPTRTTSYIFAAIPFATTTGPATRKSVPCIPCSFSAIFIHLFPYLSAFPKVHSDGLDDELPDVVVACLCREGDEDRLYAVQELRLLMAVEPAQRFLVGDDNANLLACPQPVGLVKHCLAIADCDGIANARKLESEREGFSPQASNLLHAITCGSMRAMSMPRCLALTIFLMFWISISLAKR